MNPEGYHEPEQPRPKFDISDIPEVNFEVLGAIAQRARAQDTDAEPGDEAACGDGRPVGRTLPEFPVTIPEQSPAFQDWERRHKAGEPLEPTAPTEERPTFDVPARFPEHGDGQFPIASPEQ